jgi:golgi apparatus protein 1
MAEDIDFKYPMKVACTADIQKFCDKVEKGEGRIIQCLQTKLDEVDMSSECKEEVEKDMLFASQDYRCGAAA